MRPMRGLVLAVVMIASAAAGACAALFYAAHTTPATIESAAERITRECTTEFAPSAERIADCRLSLSLQARVPAERERAYQSYKAANP
jgi:predicted acylesterase/phospholipase RssA